MISSKTDSKKYTGSRVLHFLSAKKYFSFSDVESLVPLIRKSTGVYIQQLEELENSLYEIEQKSDLDFIHKKIEELYTQWNKKMVALGAQTNKKKNSVLFDTGKGYCSWTYGSSSLYFHFYDEDFCEREKLHDYKPIKVVPSQEDLT